MNLKKVLPIMGFLLAFTAFGSLALAQPQAPSKAPAPPQISQEDRAAMESMWNEHRQKVDPVRDQYWAKKMEYNALASNPNAKQPEVKAVIDEMLKLKKEMRTLHDDFSAQMTAKGFGPGHPYHGHKFGGGYGCGYGPGFDDDSLSGRGGKFNKDNRRHHGGERHGRGLN